MTLLTLHHASLYQEIPKMPLEYMTLAGLLCNVDSHILTNKIIEGKKKKKVLFTQHYLVPLFTTVRLTRGHKTGDIFCNLY